MVPVKYLSIFWRVLEMPLINCEVNLILYWSENCVIVYSHVANEGAKFQITDTKPDVPLATLLTQDKTRILPQLESGFKRKIDLNNYQAKPELLAQNPK